MTLIFQLTDILKTIRMIKLGKYHETIKLIIESLGCVEIKHEKKKNKELCFIIL